MPNRGANDIVLLSEYEMKYSLRYNELIDEVGVFPILLVSGNIDDDDILDIISVNSSDSDLWMFRGYGNGSFERYSRLHTDDSGIIGIALGHLNNDDRIDIAVVNYINNSLGILFGRGNGEFSEMIKYSNESASYPTSLVIGDLNNGNRVDLIVALGGTNEIVSYYSNENSSLVEIRTYLLQSCRSPRSIIIADLNKDNQLDLVLSCSHSDNLVVLFGNNNGESWSEISYWIGENSSPSRLTSGDFNNDGQLDIAVTVYESSKFVVFMSDYEADFVIERKYSLSSGSRPISVAVGDCNNDNILDLVVLNSGKENIGIRLGFGDGSFGIEKVYSTGRNSNPKYVYFEDVNRDHHLDILVANSQNNSILILLGNGDGTFERTLRYSMDFHSNPVCVAAADLNDDHWSDLIIANQGIDNIEILYLYNYASFVLHETYFSTLESYPRIVSAVDMNNDKHLDIVVINYRPTSVDIYFGDGNGHFTVKRVYVMKNGSNPTGITVGDLNNDG